MDLIVQFRYSKTADFILGQYLLLVFLRNCIMSSSYIAPSYLVLLIILLADHFGRAV
jgi:hypothetical protein